MLHGLPETNLGQREREEAKERERERERERDKESELPEIPFSFVSRSQQATFILS
jgi:hypothetical protein